MKEKTMHASLEPYKSVAYKCGHLLIAGSLGIKDVSDIPSTLCGQCLRRLSDAAPQLLEALKNIQLEASEADESDNPYNVLESIDKSARAAIQAAKETA